MKSSAVWPKSHVQIACLLTANDVRTRAALSTVPRSCNALMESTNAEWRGGTSPPLWLFDSVLYGHWSTHATGLLRPIFYFEYKRTAPVFGGDWLVIDVHFQWPPAIHYRRHAGAKKGIYFSAKETIAFAAFPADRKIFHLDASGWSFSRTSSPKCNYWTFFFML